jgi:hypothetical protein
MSMNNPGVYPLCALQIIAAMPTPKLVTPIIDLDGMTAVSLEANFQYGSGSGTVTPIVATSFDGINWRHIARFDFANASRVAVANLSGLLSKAVANYADLVVEGVNDGILGDRLAVLLTSTGAYQNTTLSIRASVR